jgi:pimeloyl-ACP methyl ester carboxylesterase
MEEEKRDLRFDIQLLSQRVTGLIDWLSKNAGTKNMSIGLFGASTGAAAALVAAAARPKKVSAVVSRGGRPDLAGHVLPQVKTPTLLIVGGDDTIVIELNQKALDLLPCEKELVIIPGATHLFEEPGALEEVARDAEKWFHKHMSI